MARKHWTHAELANLEATVNLSDAGSLLGLGKSKSYALAARDEFPTPVWRLGNRLICPTAPILEKLGVDPRQLANPIAGRRLNGSGGDGASDDPSAA